MRQEENVYDFTIRNVAAGERDAAGEVILRHLGHVSVSLEEMTRTEVADWEWMTDATHGWWVVHPEAARVGLLLQGAGRVHAEWHDPATGEFYSAGTVRKLAHGAAAIVHARQESGHGIPVDVEPESAATAKERADDPVRPTWLASGTQVRYHGSLESLHGGCFWVMECCTSCDERGTGYELIGAARRGWVCVARHVRRESVTPLEGAPNMLRRPTAV